MTDRQLAFGLAAGRAIVGVALITAPARAIRPWVGGAADHGAARVLARALGARDLVIGAGALLALRDGTSVRQWLRAGVAADTVDFAASAGARDGLPATGRVAVACLAAGAAVVGARLSSSLD